MRARARLRIRFSKRLRERVRPSAAVSFPVVETKFFPRFDYLDRGGGKELWIGDMRTLVSIRHAESGRYGPKDICARS